MHVDVVMLLRFTYYTIYYIELYILVLLFREDN